MASRHPPLTIRRRKELTNVPQEHESFLKSSFRHIVSDIQAQDSIAAASQNPAEGRKYLESEVTYFCASDDLILSMKDTAKLCTLGLVALYIDPQLKGPNPDFNIMLSSLFTTLSVFASNNDIAQAGLQRSCSEYNIKMIQRVFMNRNELDEEFDSVWTHMQAALGVQNFEDSYPGIIVVALSMLLLIAKRLVHHAIPRWFYNRWRSFSQVLAIKMVVENWNAPDLEACLAFNTAISARHQIRASIFRTYRKLAGMQKGQYRNIFAVICKQLEFAEMSHIYLIMTYIYNYNPDVLSMTELMGAETSAIQRALSTIATIPEPDRPFIKLLHPSEGLDALHSKHFTKFTTAARAIASIYDRSMENYQQRENPKLDEFARTVQLHVQRKSQVSLLNAAIATSGMLNTKAGEKLLEITQEELEDEEQFQDVPLAPRT